MRGFFGFILIVALRLTLSTSSALAIPHHRLRREPGQQPQPSDDDSVSYLVRCGTWQCDLRHQYCDAIINTCARCDDDCHPGRINGNAAATEECHKNCAGTFVCHHKASSSSSSSSSRRRACRCSCSSTSQQRTPVCQSRTERRIRRWPCAASTPTSSTSTRRRHSTNPYWSLTTRTDWSGTTAQWLRPISTFPSTTFHSKIHRRRLYF